jgi:predicted RNase H-like nuclease (RuvC/YqgF family)
MTITEAAKRINEEWLSDNKEEIKKLKDKNKELENIIINLTNRIEYLEKLIGR